MSANTPLYHGLNPEAAIANIKERAAARRQDPQAKDQRMIALVVEGGAMRGVLSGGGAVALGHLGFNDIFDEVYATSAGVMNASYLLSRQTELGITCYYESLMDRRFWSPRRFWKMLDLDYVFRDVVTRQKPLDTEAVLRSPSRLLVAVIDARAGEGLMLDTKSTNAPLLDMLKAAMAVPVFYNRTVIINGMSCVDGWLAIPFPLKEAIERGCTDILVLLTRPPEFRLREPTWYERVLFSRLVCGDKKKLFQLFANHPAVAHAARQLALGITKPDRAVNILTICPTAPEVIHNTTQDPVILWQAAIDYGRRLLRVFGAKEMEWDLEPVRTEVTTGPQDQIICCNRSPV
jgi:predicted patatin/cPLA2 family phospholipase